ncbi:unnamed protein product [Sphagnum balticum]
MPSRNVVTWTAILGGCAMHGHEYTISANSEHYTCMVDLLGRAGHLQEAENMVMEMPCQPHVGAWMALLSTCRIRGNVEMAEHVAKRILDLEPDSAAGYVLLSNIYAAAGNRHLCENVARQRKEKGVKKQPSCMWIEVNNEIKWVKSSLVDPTPTVVVWSSVTICMALWQGSLAMKATSSPGMGLLWLKKVLKIVCNGH